MQELFEIQARLIEDLPGVPDRYIAGSINWKHRLILVKGSRGVGKTTLLLRQLHRQFGESRKGLYVSLDNLWFSENRLVDLADDLYKKGGTHLFVDEVHKYPNWSQHLKNIYDSYPKLHVVATGSSILELLKGNADLSRRAVVYDMHGLSFREFLQLKTGEKFDAISLKDLIRNHVAISRKICAKIRPLEFFNDYLKHGYYPFFMEGTDAYYTRLNNVINTSLETDIVLCRHVDPSYIIKLKRLLYMVALAPPMQPNLLKLSSTIEVSRQTILQYFDHLADAKLFSLLRESKKGYGTMTKPEKIYLQNTNLSYCISKEGANAGNLRETFFINQVSSHHKVEAPQDGDFIVDGHFTFEVGGKNKDRKQVKGIKNSFLALDNIEYGSGDRIPLWLFGFFY
ncbi:MAG: AAA family ATPase [Bacteroidetes bacterium]|nr:AAA family ATPase [Bacteroidota bacterium]